MNRITEAQDAARRNDRILELTQDLEGEEGLELSGEAQEVLDPCCDAADRFSDWRSTRVLRAPKHPVYNNPRENVFDWILRKAEALRPKVIESVGLAPRLKRL